MADNQSGFKNFFSNALQTGVDKVQQAAQKSGNSTFYPTTLSSQNNIKCGWLKKQGGVVKSWRKRWFTLKGDQLYYYISEDENKSPQGVIALPGNNVIELAMQANKPEEFQFEVLPGGDRSKVSTTHDTYLLNAATDEDRKEWVQALRRVMFSKVGGAIFGQSLEETLAYEQRKHGPRKVPQIVEMCVQFLMKHGLEVEGIFRLPGRTSLIRELKEQFDCGQRPHLDEEIHDVQTIASLVKLYLRELPEPLIPKSKYEKIMHQVNRDYHEDQLKAVEKLTEIMSELPVANYNLLQYIAKFLHEVSTHADVNKMTQINLATVFVHSVIRPEDEDPALLMATANGRTQTTLLLIEKNEEILKIEYTAQGSAVLVDNLLDMDIVESYTEQKTFNASDDALYSPLIDNSSSRSMVEEILENLSQSSQNNNLPQPLSPVSRSADNPQNRRGSRKGRVFNNFDNTPLSDCFEDKGDYGNRDVPCTDELEEVDGHKIHNISSASEGYSSTVTDRTPLRTIDNNHDIDTNAVASHNSHIVLRNKENSAVCDNRETCDSIASISEDYCVLTDYTSLLRKKSSQMYKEDMTEMQKDGSSFDHNNVSDEGSLYSKVIKSNNNNGGKDGANTKPDSTVPTRGDNAPPLPPKRPPVPSPRRSIKAQSVFLEHTDTSLNIGPKPKTKTKPLLKAQSVDTVYNPDLDLKHDSNSNQINSFKQMKIASISNISIKSNNSSIYQSLESLVAVDLSNSSRDELLSHIQSLHNELLDRNEEMEELKRKHSKAMQDMAQKLDKERTATQEAVDRVMALQSKMEEHQLSLS